MHSVLVGRPGEGSRRVDILIKCVSFRRINENRLYACLPSSTTTKCRVCYRRINDGLI